MTLFIHSIQHFILNRTIINYIRLYSMYLINRGIVINLIWRIVICMYISINSISLINTLIHVTIIIYLLINNSFTTHDIIIHNNILTINIFINTSIFSIDILFSMNNLIFSINMIDILLSCYYFFTFSTTIHKHSSK